MTKKDYKELKGEELLIVLPQKFKNRKGDKLSNKFKAFVAGIDRDGLTIKLLDPFNIHDGVPTKSDPDADNLYCLNREDKPFKHDETLEWAIERIKEGLLDTTKSPRYRPNRSGSMTECSFK